MQKQQVLSTNDLYRKYGAQTKDAISRYKMALRGAVSVARRKLNTKELETLLSLLREILAMDTREISGIPLDTAKGLGAVLVGNVIEGKQLVFLTLASPDYIKGEDGITRNIGVGKDKKGYHGIKTILGELAKLSTDYQYIVYLSDLDYIVESVSKDAVEAMLEANLGGLRTFYKKAERLSGFITAEDLDNVRQEIEKNEKLQKAIGALIQRSTVLSAHKISPEILREMALTYAAVGLILEREFPNAIILDVQRRLFPYQQAFYDILRKNPLPLMRPVKF